MPRTHKARVPMAEQVRFIDECRKKRQFVVVLIVF